MAITKLSNSGIKTGGVLKYDSMLAGNSAYQPTSYDSIASVSPTGTNTITFTSIPSNYKHLQIRAKYTDAGTNTLNMRFNSDTSGSYYSSCIEGNGTSVSGSAGYGNSTIQVCFRLYGGSSSSSYFGNGIIDINNYADTDKLKSVIAYYGVNQLSSGIMGVSQGMWNNTSAISSITLSLPSNFVTGTMFSLYGIRG